MVLLRPIQITVIAACACLAPAAAVAAGWFYFDPINIEAEIRFDGNRQTSDGIVETEGFLLEELVRLNQSGYIWDPAISTFNLEVVPIFRQDRRTQLGEKDSGRGNDLNYGFELGFLQAAKGPIDASVTSSRATNVNDAAFAVRNKTDISAHQFLLNWKNAYLPLRFIYSQGSYSQDFDETTGATRAWRDEDRQRYEISANNSKLKFTLDSENVDEKVQGNDYRLNRVLFRHFIPWGIGSSLRSLVTVRDRAGFNASTLINWSETAKIQHADNVMSTTQYEFNSQETQVPGADDTNKTKQHWGRFRLEHSLYDNLNSTARMQARYRDSDQVEQTELEFGGGAIYHKTFFSELDVSLNLSGDYRFTDRVTQEGAADVVNEPHVASFTERIILGQPLVDVATIQVTAEDGFTYLEGFDYEVLPFGDLFTELRIIPSGRISIGDRLLVSYQYDPFPSAQFNTLSTGYGLSLGYKWASMYHNSSRSNHELRSGSVPPPDRRDDATGILLDFRFEKWSARFRAEQRYRQIGGFESDSLLFNQALSVMAGQKLNFSLSGSQVFNESKGSIFFDPRVDEDLQSNDLSSDYYSVDAVLNWNPRSNLRISPQLGYWSRKEEVRSGNLTDSDRQYVYAGLRVSWFLRQLLLELWYKRNTIDTSFAGDDIAPTNKVDDRLLFSIRRQFR
jgi:hypothetical protein